MLLAAVRGWTHVVSGTYEWDAGAAGRAGEVGVRGEGGSYVIVCGLWKGVEKAETRDCEVGLRREEERVGC